MNLKLINLVLLISITSMVSTAGLKKVMDTENDPKPPHTTGEFPIESFAKIRVEVTFELEHEEKTQCPDKTTCKPEIKKTKLEFTKASASSGVIVFSKKGLSLVLTAGHSCKQSEVKGLTVLNVTTDITTGHGIESQAKIISVSDKADLCLLLANKNLGPAMEFTDKIIPLHTQVRVMASPLSLGGPFAIPVFEGRYFGDVGTFFSTYGFPSAPGSSGGPIFTRDGKLLSIVTAVANGFHHFTLATTVKDTSDFLKKEIKLFREQKRIKPTKD